MHKTIKNPPNCFAGPVLGETKINRHGKGTTNFWNNTKFCVHRVRFLQRLWRIFQKCEIGRIHALLPLHEMAVRFGLVNQKNGNPDYLLRHPYGKRSTIGKENCKSGTLPGCPDTYLSNIIPHTRDNYVLMIQKSDRKTTKLRKKADEGSFGRYALVNQYQLL